MLSSFSRNFQKVTILDKFVTGYEIDAYKLNGGKYMYKKMGKCAQNRIYITLNVQEFWLLAILVLVEAHTIVESSQNPS